MTLIGGKMRKTLLVILLLGTRAFASVPANPQTQIFSAPGGAFIARIEPSITNFMDQPSGRATLTLFRYSKEKQNYDRMVEFILDNQVSPGEVLISPDGHTIVGIGDFYDLEFKSPVVVFYGPDGTVLKKLFLDDVLSKQEAADVRSSNKRWYIRAELSATRLLIQRDVQVGGPGSYKKSVVIDPTSYKVSDYTP